MGFKAEFQLRIPWPVIKGLYNKGLDNDIHTGTDDKTLDHHSLDDFFLCRSQIRQPNFTPIKIFSDYRQVSNIRRTFAAN